MTAQNLNVWKHNLWKVKLWNIVAAGVIVLRDSVHIYI